MIKQLLTGAALVALASPALADHTGPGGLGSGSGLDVFSPDTLDEGRAAVGSRLLYTLPHDRSDSRLEALALDGIDAHNTDYNLSASLSAAYGITHELTVSAELPYLRRDHLREGESNGGAAAVDRIGTVDGIGDANVLAKYRLTREQGLRFAILGGLKIPTGATHRRAPSGERLETEHQPGTGSWDPIVGASAAVRAGLVQLTASALYQFSTTGAHRTRLGDRLQGGLSLSHHFGPVPAAEEEEHNHAHHEHEHVARHDSWDAFVELGGEWEGRQRIGGDVEAASGGTWIYVAPGARFNSAAGWSFGGGVAVPVWQRIRNSHPNNALRVMLSLGKAF